MNRKTDNRFRQILQFVIYDWVPSEKVMSSVLDTSEVILTPILANMST